MLIWAQYLEQGVLCVEVLRHRHGGWLNEMSREKSEEFDDFLQKANVCLDQLHFANMRSSRMCRSGGGGPELADEERCELERCLQVPSAWKRDTNSAVAAA